MCKGLGDKKEVCYKIVFFIVTKDFMIQGDFTNFTIKCTVIN